MNEIIETNNEEGNIESSLNYILLHNLKKDSKILDIGCNYGSLIENLFKQGYKEVNGIDVNKESIKKGKLTYTNIKSKINYYDGKTIPFKEGSFDVILMFDVIEHIPNIKDFLKNEVYRVLKKNGILIFQTPNKLTNIPWEILNTKSFTKYKTYHMSLQTKRKLKILLNKSGFKDIKLEKYNIKTKHNIEYLGKKISKPIAKFSLNMLSSLPLSLNSNFWGSAKK